MKKIMKRNKFGRNLFKSFLVLTIVALSAKIFTIFISEPLLATDGNEITKILVIPLPLLLFLVLILTSLVNLYVNFVIFLLEKANKYL